MDPIEADLEVRVAALEERIAPRIVYIGDSTAQFNIGVQSNPPTYCGIGTSAFGEIENALNLARIADATTWYDASVGTTNIQGANQGFGGQTTADIIARMAVAADQAPDLVIISVGINDLRGDVQNDVVIANLQQIVAYFLDRGSKVIFINMRPLSLPTYTRQQDVMVVNAAMAVWIATQPNCILFDAHSLYAAADGQWLPGYNLMNAGVPDGVHPNAFASSIGAASLAAILRDVLKGDIQAYPTFGFGNLMPNPTLSGTAGSPSNRVTGSVASQYLAFFTDGSQIVAHASLVQNGTNGFAQALTFTGNASGNAVEHLAFVPAAGSIALPASSQGLWYRMWVEIDVAPCAGLAAWHCEFYGVDPQGAYTKVLAHQPMDESQDTFFPAEYDQILMTPPYQVPAGVSSVAPMIMIGLRNGPWGSGSVTIKRWWLGQVPDPRLDRNFPAAGTTGV